jgi:hypothetical protein
MDVCLGWGGDKCSSAGGSTDGDGSGVRVVGHLTRMVGPLLFLGSAASEACDYEDKDDGDEEQGAACSYSCNHGNGELV